MNRVVDTADKYFDEVLKPQYDAFLSDPSSFPSAFNLASALFHFHEWMLASHKAAVEKHYGKSFKTEGAFWAEVESSNAQFGYVRDLANASKHVELTKRRSTPMKKVAQASMTDGAFGPGFQRDAFQTSQIKIEVGSQVIDFDTCAKALFSYWANLRAALK
jgi:hypothetical protein